MSGTELPELQKDDLIEALSNIMNQDKLVIQNRLYTKLYWILFSISAFIGIALLYIRKVMEYKTVYLNNTGISFLFLNFSFVSCFLLDNRIRWEILKGGITGLDEYTNKRVFICWEQITEWGYVLPTGHNCRTHVSFKL